MSWKLIDQFFSRPDLKLPPHQITVFIFLLLKAREDGTAVYPKVATIASAARISERQCQYILRELEQNGFIIAVDRRGGQRSALWNIPVATGPMGQENWITPKKEEQQPSANPAPDRRGQKQRPVRLVKVEEEEPFLDTDQADQAGNQRGQIHILRTPSGDLFYASLLEQEKMKRAELTEKQQHVAGLATKIAAKNAAGKPGGIGILESMRQKAEMDIDQLNLELAELAELLVEQQQTQRREVL